LFHRKQEILPVTKPTVAANDAAASPAAVVLSKAVVRAAEQLDLRQAQLARMLGLSTATVSRLASGDWRLPEDSKAWELATAFVRVYRSLSAITGGKVPAMRNWLHSGNAALGREPAQMIVTTEGLIHVLHYLDAARSRI
jgi:transcriptional regulator with XRE-family HTH domain